MNPPAHRSAALANAAKSFSSNCFTVANAHAVLATLCVLKLPTRCSTTLANVAQSLDSLLDQYNNTDESCAQAGTTIVVPDSQTLVSNNATLIANAKKMAGVNLVLGGIVQVSRDAQNVPEWCDENPASRNVEYAKSYKKEDLYFHEVTDEEAGYFSQEHAVSVCRSASRDLVSVMSSAENRIVVSFAQESVSRRNATARVRKVVIGCNDTKAEGRYVWTDGSPFVYRNFAVEAAHRFKVHPHTARPYQEEANPDTICSLAFTGNDDTRGTWDTFNNNHWLTQSPRGLVCGPKNFKRLFDPCDSTAT